MMDTYSVDVLIIGSGPAGMSTALHLVQANPLWAKRMVVVDKAIHPREKICGGGITRPGEQILSELGLPFEPEHIPVSEIQFVYRNESYALRDSARPVFRVVRRDVFDHWLVQQAQKQGVTINQGEAVTGVVPRAAEVEVHTGRALYRAKVVVVADGSRSRVRAQLEWPRHKSGAHLARLLEILTPEKIDEREFQQGVAVFDFSPVKAGVQGYYWDFPSRVQGKPVMNRGIFDSRAYPQRSRASLKETLNALLSVRNRHLKDYPLKGHPIHWFDRRGCFARPRIILAGDAAGVDPFVGEGISFALAYGRVAAKAVSYAFLRGDFTFADYKSRILNDALLGQLPVRTALARFVYGFRSPWQLNLLWRAAPLIVRFLGLFSPSSMPVESPRLIKLS